MLSKGLKAEKNKASPPPLVDSGSFLLPANGGKGQILGGHCFPHPCYCLAGGGEINPNAFMTPLQLTCLPTGSALSSLPWQVAGPTLPSAAADGGGQ